MTARHVAPAGESRFATCGWLLGCALLVVACSGTGLFASSAEYDQYRRSRVAPSVEERLAAAAEYLRENPEGTFSREVRAWFSAAEPRYFASAKQSVARLKTYLAVLPLGPHAAAARSQILALQQAAELKLRTERARALEDRAITDALAAAKRSREEFVQEFAEWARALAATEGLSRPMSELAGDFAARYASEVPSMACTDDGCVKSVTRSFGIPENGKLALRQVSYELHIELVQGSVRSVSIAGSGLFVALVEAISVKPFVTEPRAVETDQALVSLLENATESALPAAECARERGASMLLRRECRGKILEASSGGGGPDRLELRAAEGAPTQPATPAPGAPAAGATVPAPAAN
jgi:hypothetical protein